MWTDTSNYNLSAAETEVPTFIIVAASFVLFMYDSWWRAAVAWSEKGEPVCSPGGEVPNIGNRRANGARFRIDTATPNAATLRHDNNFHIYSNSTKN